MVVATSPGVAVDSGLNITLHLETFISGTGMFRIFTRKALAFLGSQLAGSES